MRQGLLEKGVRGGGGGGAKTLAHYRTNKKSEGDSKLGKRSHSFRLQTYDDEQGAKEDLSIYDRCAKRVSVIRLFVQGQNVWQDKR